jgi:antitoxin component YwqK of YwqJK toxin-antitoxin module
MRIVFFFLLLVASTVNAQSFETVDCDEVEGLDMNKLVKTPDPENPKNFFLNRMYFEGVPYTGKAKLCTASGYLFQKTSYLDGKKDGKSTVYGSDGVLSEVMHYRNGNEHGKMIRYREDGQVLESGEYIDGKRTGEWILYNKYGGITLKQNYLDGELVTD